MTLSNLLPPNATALERALADAIETHVDPSGLRGIRLAPPPAYLPWLASEWRLADLSGYFPDTAALIAAGKPWLKVRGTAAAVKLALSWLDLVVSIDSDGARLQLDTGRVIDSACLRDVQQLVGASIPVHVWFYRIYHHYDIRPLRLDQSRLDDAMLDDDSGVWAQGIKVSFGTGHAVSMTDDESPVEAGMTRQYSTRVWDDNSWRLDAWALDSEIQIDAASGQISQQTAALPIDSDEPTYYYRYDRCVTVLPVADDTVLTCRSEQRASAITDEMRHWTGPWTGPWRQPIPSRTTFEVA